MCRIARVLAAGVKSTESANRGSTKDFATMIKAKISLFKCTDMPESSLLAYIVFNTPIVIEATHEI